MSALLQALDDADEAAEDRKPFETGSNDALDAALREIARAAVAHQEAVRRYAKWAESRDEDTDAERLFAAVEDTQAALFVAIDAAEGGAS